MKKSIFALLAFFVCIFQPLSAYEYFTICFSDGTKSEAFYATDVDSICYSKIGLDSLEYFDWQIQEIYTCDSVYRYPLAEIDSLSFKDVDINNVAEDIDRANSAIVPLYMQCESIAELSQHLSTINDIEGVENVWIDEQALFVKIRDYGTITFLYPPTPSSSESEEDSFLSQSRNLIRRSNVQATGHIPNNVHNACVYYQLEKNEDPVRNTAKKFSIETNNAFNNLGISSQRITNDGPEFFVKNIFNYDLIFLITHGSYDKKTDTHWLLTGEEVASTAYEDDIFTISENLKQTKIYSPNKLCYTWVLEYRNSQWYAVFYSCVSDKLIASSRNCFKGFGTIIFNTACESLKNNNNLANVFINKGAGCYLGYTDTNRTGHAAGYEFYSALLNGSCIGNAYEHIHSLFKEESFSVNDQTYHPELRMVQSNNDVSKDCITHSESLPIEDISSNNAIQVKLHGRIKKLNTFPTDYQYGFQWSTNSNMSQAKRNKADANNYNTATHYMTWEKTLNESSLQPNTTYYYCAYMYDGYSYCYGEVKSFRTPDVDICPDGNHPHVINLGLPSGTKWYCCNLGATSPNQYGDYIQWTQRSTTSSGRIPNAQEAKELINYCTSKWTTYKGVNGRLFTGPNGKKIFLPATGYKWPRDGYIYDINIGGEGNYWTTTESSDSERAYDLEFNASNVFVTPNGVKTGYQTIRTVK